MNIVILVAVPGAEEYIVSAAVMGKVIADMGHVAHIIRMQLLELSADEPLHDLLPVHFHQAAEAVRNQQRNDLPFQSIDRSSAVPG